jgi:RNA polymerase sigma-70 factor (ECF subfamily)
MDDGELLKSYYSSRNEIFLGSLLERYSMLIFGVCMKYLKDREEAKDAVQQVFLKVIGELDKYKVEYFKSWIYRIAQNHCLMQLRRKGLPEKEINEQILWVQETDTRLQESERTSKTADLMHALLTLNPEQQQCIVLFYLKKMSYAEISSSTGLSVMQVKSHIQNGKRNLKIQLGGGK